ncbi:lecithin-cholesterol acyltransferase-like 1 [Typha angustifolia]|uniref:lecithin-cholesterol acyltransferase-like 1 n=1 Tax=Typha angustifolia TaxID=59011 RepID=UPI003C2C86FD
MKAFFWASLLFHLLSPLPIQCILPTPFDPHPLVLIPGQGGNQLMARLTDDYVSTAPNCEAAKGKGWFRLWINYTNLLEDPFARPCFAEQMTIFYGPDLDDYSNAPGVVTRAPFFGSTRGFRYRDPDHKTSKFIYMEKLVKQLEAIGYEEGKSLFGAPYDFRYGLAAEGHNSKVGSQFLDDLKELVEKASKWNENKPVIILTHSLGGLFALQMLNCSPLSWRRKFIHRFIALSAPWGGTVVEMRVLASGASPLGLSFLDPLLVREEKRSFDSNLWLLPSPKVFGEDTLLVMTKDKKYSASDIADFLRGIGFSEGVGPYESRILPLVREYLGAAPGVPVTCVVGFGIQTHETVVYGEGGFDAGPEEVIYGDGDGLVNLVSLLALEKEWSNLPQQELKMVKLPNVSHEGILTDDLALREVIKQVYEASSIGMTTTS